MSIRIKIGIIITALCFGFCISEETDKGVGACIYSNNFDTSELSETVSFATFCEDELIENECRCGSLYGGDCVIEFKEASDCETEEFTAQCDNGYYVEDAERDCGEPVDF